MAKCPKACTNRTHTHEHTSHGVDTPAECDPGRADGETLAARHHQQQLLVGQSSCAGTDVACAWVEFVLVPVRLVVQRGSLTSWPFFF